MFKSKAYPNALVLTSITNFKDMGYNQKFNF